MRSHTGRFIWVLLTNGAFLFLSIVGYAHEIQLQQMLRPGRAVSAAHVLASDPWGTLAVLALLAGIVLELTRLRIAAIVNCGYYLVALLVGIWGIWSDNNSLPPEHIGAGLYLYIVPVFVVAVVDFWLYRSDLAGFKLWKKGTDGFYKSS